MRRLTSSSATAQAAGARPAKPLKSDASRRYRGEVSLQPTFQVAPHPFCHRLALTAAPIQPAFIAVQKTAHPCHNEDKPASVARDLSGTNALLSGII
jgi:hypothetical protein